MPRITLRPGTRLIRGMLHCHNAIRPIQPRIFRSASHLSGPLMKTFA
jgi:hypothetical protein